MSTEATKLDIMNSALRMVGSFHLEASDTTSTTYDIANSAYSQAVTEVFGDNIFRYNTRRVKLNSKPGLETSFLASEGYTSAGDAASNPDWEGNTIKSAQWQISPTTETLVAEGDNYKNLRTTSVVTAAQQQLIRFEHTFDFGPGTKSSDAQRVYMFSLTDMDEYPDVSPSEDVLSNPNLSFQIKFEGTGSSAKLKLQHRNNGNAVVGTPLALSSVGSNHLFKATLDVVVGKSSAVADSYASITLENLTGTGTITDSNLVLTSAFYDSLTQGAGVKANIQSGGVTESNGISKISVHSVYFRNVTTVSRTSAEFVDCPNEFTLPNDLNLLVKVEDAEDELYNTYKLANGNLYSSLESLNITYAFLPVIETSAITLPGFLFRLLTLHMAQNIAIELSGSENRHEILHRQYGLALRRAKTLDGRQAPPAQYLDSSMSGFISAHQNYGKV